MSELFNIVIHTLNHASRTIDLMNEVDYWCHSQKVSREVAFHQWLTIIKHLSSSQPSPIKKGIRKPISSYEFCVSEVKNFRLKVTISPNISAEQSVELESGSSRPLAIRMN